MYNYDLYSTLSIEINPCDYQYFQFLNVKKTPIVSQQSIVKLLIKLVDHHV